MILPDIDEPGRNHAQLVARKLSGKARSVKVVELPGLGEKGDVSDWLSKGGTAESLHELVASCLLLPPAVPAGREESVPPEMDDSAGAKTGEADEPTRRQSVATLLVSLVVNAGATLFRTPDHAAYVRVPVDAA